LINQLIDSFIHWGKTWIVHPLEFQQSHLPPDMSAGISAKTEMDRTIALSQNPAKTSFLSLDLPEFFPPVMGWLVSSFIIQSAAGRFDSPGEILR
jgi:hypothetical protein